MKIYADGSIATNQTTGTNKSISIFNGGTNQTAYIQSNGSAKFAGAVIHGQLHAGGTGGNYLSNGEVAAYGPTSSSHLWRGWDVSGSSNFLTSSISAAGDATFAGGNVKTHNR